MFLLGSDRMDRVKRRWALFALAWCLVVSVGCSVPRPSTEGVIRRATAPQTDESPDPHPGTSGFCGNGRIEDGERCDFGVEYEEGCPNGWGLCYECDSTCQGFVLVKPLKCDDTDLPSEHEEETYNLPHSIACVERHETHVIQRTYDAKGRVTLSRTEWNLDGSFERQERVMYNASGHKTEIWLDGDGDEKPEFTYRASLDSERNIISAERHYLPGKASTYRKDWRYKGIFDDQGRLLREEVDTDEDGDPDRVQSFQYDKKGRLVSATAWNTWVRYAYDNEGRLVFRASDQNGDGLHEWSEQTRYDELGNLVLWERSRDGKLELRWLYSYHSLGELASTQIDNNGDGTIDFRRDDLIDESGKFVCYEVDHDGDGHVDATCRVTYDADGNRTTKWIERNGNKRVVRTNKRAPDGRLLFLEEDSNEDGIIDNRQRYHYDSRGSLVRWEQDTDGDGAFERRFRTRRDTKGRITLEEQDHDVDGDNNVRVTTTYNREGNATSVEVDRNRDGSVDGRWTYDYTCLQAQYKRAPRRRFRERRVMNAPPPSMHLNVFPSWGQAERVRQDSCW